MSTQVPRLLTGLVDDAAVFPPGSAALSDALAAHRRHRASWYADLVGPLLVPASALPRLARLLDTDQPAGPDQVGDTPAGQDRTLDVGVIGDVPLDQLGAVCAVADPRLRIRQVEAAVAKRGEDPLPGLAELAALAARSAPAGSTGPGPDLDVYAEIPLAWGLLGALDRLAEARAAGTRIAAKFRTGGLAAELFPTAGELATVICACRDRELPFKLTAGLHHATRNVDPETGFTHHGFVNVLAAVRVAAEGGAVDAVTEVLTTTDPRPLLQRVEPGRDEPRPLWIGFGSCSVGEPLTDLIRLGLVDGGFTR
ncbi:hypothetical protein [Micromonospora cathayae]|uniref:Uncharacterized protein n=1 Tax=Micromonospora cathayae TaxID=3028804 RepID=A0ABY7ZRZ3_9ACTN|nr:hypothetical protein [Micromonospora sp. HUAS 3]WDZ85665.1 hypothetical protein PVK37_04230 [Micromonospora sp. HUAS 3]